MKKAKKSKENAVDEIQRLMKKSTKELFEELGKKLVYIDEESHNTLRKSQSKFIRKDFYTDGCPDCGNKDFSQGACGGGSINITCTSCKSKFNDMGMFGVERIGDMSNKKEAKKQSYIIPIIEDIKEMCSLLDGAIEIVCLWEAKSPSQIEWKKNWMAKARKYGAEIE